ncbi:hypothetical protein ACLB1N_34290 [Escherichia coli]
MHIVRHTFRGSRLAEIFRTIEYTIDAKTDKLLIAGRRADDTFDNIERGAKRADNSISKLNTTVSKLAAAVNVGLLMMAAKRFIEIADNVKLLRAVYPGCPVAWSKLKPTLAAS